MKLDTICSLPLLFIPLLAALGQQDVTASISGQLLAEDTSLPIPYGIVLAVSTPTAQGDSSVIESRAGKDGRFEFNGQVGQRYSLCVRNSGEYLDPCRWADAVRSVVVAATNSFVELTVSHGVPLRVSVRYDPALLKSENTKAPNGIQIPRVGAFLKNVSTGAERVLPYTDSRNGVVEYFEMVPATQFWKIAVSGPNAQLATSTGTPFASDALFPIPNAPTIPVRAHGAPASNERVVPFILVRLN